MAGTPVDEPRGMRADGHPGPVAPDDRLDDGPEPAAAEHVGPDRRRLLLARVERLRARQTRRGFDSSVHVGALDGDECGFVIGARDLPVLDVALRIDVLTALLQATPSTWRTAWLVRAGTPDPQPQDLHWLAAAGAALAVHGRALDDCFVITPAGWREVRTGERWSRPSTRRPS